MQPGWLAWQYHRVEGGVTTFEGELGEEDPQTLRTGVLLGETLW